MTQTEVIIPEKIFFKIGEVCELVGVQAHVLRYWETEFPMLSPKKNKSGQRTYRRKDVEIALSIKDLLYEELFTIAGAKKKLQAEIRSGSKAKSKAKETSDELAMQGQLDLKEEVLLEVEQPAKVNSAIAQDIGDLHLDDDKRDALKSLVSQLLELREMLKTNHTLEAEQHIGGNKPI